MIANHSRADATCMNGVQLVAIVNADALTVMG